MTTRDMTHAQYRAKMKGYGFKPWLFAGYWELPDPLTIKVSDWNAGDNRRAKLAYMLKQWEREKKKENKG